jgi:hypothetical protein
MTTLGRELRGKLRFSNPPAPSSNFTAMKTQQAPAKWYQMID